MSTFDERRGIVDAGDGLIARWPSSVLVCLADDPAASGAVIADVTADLDGPPGAGRLIERLRAVAAGSPVADFASVIDTGDALRVMVLGSGVAVIGERRVTSTGALVEIEVAHDSGHLLVGQVDTGAFSLTATDLRSGVVPGGAVKLAGREQALVPPPPVEPEAEVAEAPRPFASVDLRGLGQSSERTPLPVLAGLATEADAEVEDDVAEQVHGIHCSRGHFNNPLAAYCLVCGISMVHLTHNLVEGTRPTLGFVVFDDGTTYALDRSYVMGRDPDEGATDRLHALVTDDPNHTVSRVHAVLELVEWDVTLRDLGSTNGTFLWNPAAGRWDHVQPNNPTTLRPGAQVSLGRRTFVYESVHRV